MKKLILSLFLVSPGCIPKVGNYEVNIGYTKQYLVTKHGLYIDNRTDFKLSEQRLTYLTEKLTLYLNKKENVIAGTKVIFGSKLLPLKDNNQVWLVDGIYFSYNSPRLIYIALFSECVELSSFLHELTHLLGGPTHKEDPQFWENLETFEQTLSQENCSEEQIQINQLNTELERKTSEKQEPIRL